MPVENPLGHGRRPGPGAQAPDEGPFGRRGPRAIDDEPATLSGGPGPRVAVEGSGGGVEDDAVPRTGGLIECQYCGSQFDRTERLLEHEHTAHAATPTA